MSNLTNPGGRQSLDQESSPDHVQLARASIEINAPVVKDGKGTGRKMKETLRDRVRWIGSRSATAPEAARNLTSTDKYQLGPDTPSHEALLNLDLPESLATDEKQITITKHEHNSQVELLIRQFQDQLDRKIEEHRMAILRKDQEAKEAQESYQTSLDEWRNSYNDAKTRIWQQARQHKAEMNEKDAKLVEKRKALENANAEKRKQIDAIKLKHNNEITSNKQQHKLELEQKQRKYEDVRDDLEKTKFEHRRKLEQLKNGQQDEISRTQKKIKAELERRTREYEMDVKDLQKAVDDLKHNARLEERRRTEKHSEEVEQIHSAYAEEIRKTEGIHEKAISDLETRLANVIAQAEDEKQRMLEDHDKALDNINLEHTSELSKLIQEHEENEGDLRKELKGTKEASDRKTKEMTSSHARAVEQLKEAHGEAVSQLEQAQKAKEAKLTLKHQQQTKDLHSQVQQLNTALLTQDDEIYRGQIFATSGLPRKPDGAIRDQFLEIQQMVEELSRQKWKPDQNIWTDEILRKVGGQQNQRLLKKAILQDIIWTLLFNLVFCSPFRIFGEEGRALEREWCGQCDTDAPSSDGIFSWPSPSVKAERWRYLTMMGCREALMKPVPSQHDPRARVKKGYKSCLDGLLKELKAVLEDMIDLAPSDFQILERLAKRVPSMWSEFEMHRCRIVVILKGSGARSTAEQAALARSSSLELTVSPTLGRYGNVNGLELDIFTAIDGCFGESLTIP